MVKKAGGVVKILIANGVNLDLLGQREPEIYGNFDLRKLESLLKDEVASLAKALGWAKIELEFFQSNDESDFLRALSQFDGDGAVVNPGAWTHTSLALADRLAAIKIPFVEVHISNIAAREEYRQKSYSAPKAKGVVYGFGIHSYLVGIFGLLRSLR